MCRVHLYLNKFVVLHVNMLYSVPVFVAIFFFLSIKHTQFVGIKVLIKEVARDIQIYRIYPKYWKTLSSYHTCPKI